MPNRGPVDRDLVKELGRAATENALALVEEADLLDSNGHVARAFALTILAAEELGKAFVCAGTLAHAGDDPGEWQAFWTVIGSKQHDVKVFTALWLEQRLLGAAGTPFDALAEELRGLSYGELNADKFRALYVDLEGDRVAVPSEIGTDADQRQRAKTLRKSITVWAIGFQVGSFEKPSSESGKGAGAG